MFSTCHIKTSHGIHITVSCSLHHSTFKYKVHACTCISSLSFIIPLAAGGLVFLLLSLGLDLVQEGHAPPPAATHHGEGIGSLRRRILGHSRVLPLHQFLETMGGDAWC